VASTDGFTTVQAIRRAIQRICSIIKGARNNPQRQRKREQLERFERRERFERPKRPEPSERPDWILS